MQNRNINLFSKTNRQIKTKGANKGSKSYSKIGTVRLNQVELHLTDKKNFDFFAQESLNYT